MTLRVPGSSLCILLLAGGLPLAAGPRDLKGFFARACAACHGPDGSGRALTGQRLPGRPLTDAKALGRASDAELAKVILAGRGAMPGYRGLLSEEDAQRMVAEVVRPLARRK